MAEVARAYASKAIRFPSENVPQTFTVTESELRRIVQSAIEDVTKTSRSHKQCKTDSLYMEDGRRKPTPADPIRSKEEFQKVVEYFETHGKPELRCRNKTIFILGCSVGLRCGDILKLKTADVYNESGCVKEHLEVIEQKTGKRNTCKISKMAANALEEYREENDYPIDEETFLFQSNKNGGRIEVKSFWRILKKAGEECGLDIDLSTHTMRKTYAMAALLSAEQNGTAGQTLEMLQMKLNHSDARITMKYCKAAQDKMDEMSDQVSDWFDGE